MSDVVHRFKSLILTTTKGSVSPDFASCIVPDRLTFSDWANRFICPIKKMTVLKKNNFFKLIVRSCRFSCF